MKQSTIAKRLDKLNISKLSLAYQAVNSFTGRGESRLVRSGKIRPVEGRRSGRRYSYTNHSQSIIEILNDCKLKYEVGNDAPRGGAEGAYIKILTKIERDEK